MTNKKILKTAAAMAAIAIATYVASSGMCLAQGNSGGPAAPTNSTQNVNVVNTPTVSLSGTPTVNVGTMPAVSLSGTPAVNVANSPTVHVGNTLSGPVPALDAEKVSRIPYQSFVNLGTCVGPVFCQFHFTQAPAGYRLVAENISGFLALQGTSATAPVGFLSDGSHNAEWGFTAPAIPAQPFLTNLFSGFNEHIRAYFDPSDGQPTLQVFANFIGTQNATLSGYLENCAVTGCPAIQR